MADIKSKSSLSNLSGQLNSEVSNFLSTASDLDSYVKGLEPVDGIDPTSLGNSLSSSLQSLANRCETVSNNIENYINEIYQLDVYDQNGSTTTEDTTTTTEDTTTTTGDTTTANPVNTENTEETVFVPPIIDPNLIPENKEDTINTQGIKSQNGMTPQSAKTNIKIYKGNPNVDTSKYKNNAEKGFVVTTGNMAYKLSEEDVNILCAIVASQSDNSYDDALAVMSIILNRSENKDWISYFGRDPMLQATAENQFVIYNSGYYKKYMNNNIPEPVSTAVRDCLNGVRNHKYLQINSYEAFSNNYISDTGNRYK